MRTYQIFRVMAAIALMLTVLFLGNICAQSTNPSENVQNGAIWRYSSTPGSNVVDPNFNQALAPSDVRISQQIIADIGKGLFDVEVKVQVGANINKIQNATIVFLIDESGSILPNEFSQIKDACIEMVNMFPPNITAEFGIVLFSNGSRTVLNPTTNRNQVITSLRTIFQYLGGTNLYQGFQNAEFALNRSTLPTSTPQHIILITDGYPNLLPAGFYGDPMLKSLEKAKQLKAKGVLLNVAGFGDVNPSFFDQIASSTASCKIAYSLQQLKDILVGPDGFANSFIDNAKKNVAVSMAPGVDFLKVVSNNGGDYTISSSDGTLYWDPKLSSNPTDVSTLVYRIQLDEQIMAATTKTTKITTTKITTTITTLKDTKGLTILPKTLTPALSPISSSALFNYVDASGKPRSEKFDIPKACYPIQKNTLTIDDLTFSLKGVAYDGNEHPIAVTLKKGVPFDGKLAVEYNGSVLPKPKEIGDYFISVSAPETPTYYKTNISLGLFTIAPNSQLMSITVTGKKSYVTLPGSQFNYDIFVPTHDNSVTITATPADPRSKIQGTGSYKLHPNNPTTVTITVTSATKTVTVYKLNLLRVLGDGNNVIRLE